MAASRLRFFLRPRKFADNKKMEPNPDFLESSVLLNETQYNEGYNDGYNNGLLSGEEEGRDVGLKVGFEIGEELGFYRGCVDIWKSVVRVDSGAFSSRIQKTIEQLSELLNKYPLLEPENEGIQEMMNAIRLKFRLISANLGVKLEYEGYPKSSKQEFEDI
ncbi:oral cancer-overexpressed protein 1 homolog isoform X3 [Asparagus officinalis]|uniref:oral cancer-overexpressed protein 1 homolog isoform X3 n=1 Tax=Asparagus officinalis TaxID=4686 RepID=UPI00098E24FF|nr:oral cancer-overexpressed protein 1 homolog isoform X3 [Asparagus officinalis]